MGRSKKKQQKQNILPSYSSCEQHKEIFCIIHFPDACAGGGAHIKTT